MKWAVCNELFGSMDFSKACGLLAENEFKGVEIAPFTLAEDPGNISPRVLKETRSILKDSGLLFAGFHWLFVKPPGLHATSSDPVKRQKALEHLKGLLRAAGELGGGNLIFGSPKQREILDVPLPEGRKYFMDLISQAADTAREANSVICLEALASKDTNLLNTLKEVEDFVNELGHPAVSGMFDFHNCGDETLPWQDLIVNHQGMIKHVHLNQEDGSHPQAESADAYGDAWEALRTIGYDGWVSLEIFTVPKDPQRVIRETAEFLNRVSSGF